MKTWLTIAAAAAGLLTVAACDSLPTGDDGWEFGDTGDTGWSDDNGGDHAPMLTSVDWSCSTSTGGWFYYGATDGWAGAITLDIFETGSSVPWDESHELQSAAYDPAGYWDEWESNLSKVSTPSAVVPGRSTLFECGYHSDDSLTWMMTVYDEANRVSDCAVWGHRPSYWTSERGYRDCVNWN